MKKVLLTLSAILLFVGMGLSADVSKVRYVMPGDKPAEYDTVIKAVNAKLATDANLELDITYIPWDAWEQKINLMIASGEAFDLFQVMQDWIPYATYYARGGLQDIGALLDKYGPNIKKAIPDSVWPGAKLNGKTYVVPAFWVELGSDGDFTYRKDLLNAAGLPVPKTPDDLINAVVKISKTWKGSDKPYLPIRGGDVGPIATLHRSFASFPFIIKENLIWVNEKGEVKSWVETDEFKQEAAWCAKAYKAGVISPDVLVTKQ
jgi:putative aldouronate transport system substrate-binding protein